MKSKMVVLGMSVIFSFGCSSQSNKQEVKHVTATSNLPVVYKSLTINQCARIIFPDYKVDSVYTETAFHDPLHPEEESTWEEHATGAVDTSWYWIPKSPEEIKARYLGDLNESSINPESHLDPRVKDTAGKNWVKYVIKDAYRDNSVIALVYSVYNATVNGSREGNGIAIFVKGAKGWALQKNDFVAYKYVDSNERVVSVSKVKVGTDSRFLFVSESDVGGKLPLNRHLYLTDYNLINQPIASSQFFEVEGGKYIQRPGRYFTGGGLHNIYNAGVEHIILSLLDVDSCKLKLVLNSQGKATKFRFFSLSQPNQELLSGEVIEIQTLDTNVTSGAKSYKQDLCLVGLWKNFYRKKVAFFTGVQMHTYAEGALTDSLNVLARGTQKLNERREIAAEEASARHENDKFFDRMKAQQDQNRAVDEVIRKAGLCSYCSGKGCLQCGGTGKLQRGY